MNCHANCWFPVLPRGLFYKGRWGLATVAPGPTQISSATLAGAAGS